MRPSTLRQSIAEHLTGVLGAAGWKESTYPYPLFPDLETRYGHHLTFAVGLRAEGVGPGRQRTTEGLVVSTEIRVKYVVNLEVGTLAAYDLALDAEKSMVTALGSLKTAAPNAVPLRIENIQTRDAAGDGTVYLGEITCSVLHVYPLSE